MSITARNYVSLGLTDLHKE